MCFKSFSDAFHILYKKTKSILQIYKGFFLIYAESFNKDEHQLCFDNKVFLNILFLLVAFDEFHQL